MSQIGEGKTGIEGLGRLLGTGEGKAGRLAAGLGGGAREEFARLMASAQGRFKADGPIEGAGAATKGGPGASGGKAFAEALEGLADQLAKLRDALGGAAGKGASAGQAGADAEPAGIDSLRSALDDLVGELEDRIARLEGGPGAGRVSGTGEDPAGGRSLVEGWPGAEGARPLGGQHGGQAGGEGDALLDSTAGTSSTMAELGAQVEALTDALARLKQSFGTDQAQAPAAMEGLMDRLASLRDGLVDARAELQGGRAGDASAMPAGLLGQMQALEQALQRAQAAAGGEVRAARGMAASRGDGQAGWDGNWRFAETGRRAAGSNESVRLGGNAGAESARNADWTGGPVSAALGLTGSEANTVARERAPLTRWSALNGLEGQGAPRGESESALSGNPNATTGLGGSPASMMSSAAPASGIFTGQAAAGTPNPQMPAQLGQQIQWMVGKGVSKASIELRPADLGPLKIAIETQGDETRIALTATNATAQGLLEQQLPRLKEWLQEAGLANSEVEVDLGQESDFGQQLADADEGGESNPGETGGGAGQSNDADAAELAGVDPDGADGGDDSVAGRLVLDLFA